MAGRHNAIILLLAVAMFAVVLSSSATAQQSTISISVVDGNGLVVGSVFDDDGSIEFVDLFISDGISVNQYSYSGVIQGQGLYAPFNSSSTIYYNFMDSDGQIVNVGYFVYVQNPSPPDEPVSGSTEPRVVMSYEIDPQLTEDNRSYNLEYIFDLNTQLSIGSAELKWALGEGNTNFNKSAFLTSESSGRWKTTIGPFVGKTVVNSNLLVTELSGKTTVYGTGNRGFYLLVSDEAACNLVAGGGVVVVNTAPSSEPEEKTVINFQQDEGDYSGDAQNTSAMEGTTLLLQQTLSDFSYLKIVNVSGTITATEVYDNDGSIGTVDIFVIDEGSSTQYSYTNVGVGTTFPVSIPAGGTAYYNYMDYDGSIANISFNNIIGDGTLVQPKPGAEPSMLENVSVDATPDEAYSSYKVNFEVTTNDSNYNIASVVMRYREQGSSQWLTISLQKSNGTWTGEIGQLTNERQFSFELVMTDSAGESEVRYPYSFWFDIVSPYQVKCIEICGNREDDDKDGLVDEECVLLPDLFFISTEEVPGFVVLGTPIKVPFSIKNAGVADSEPFDVALLMNNELVEVIPAEALKVGEQADLQFTINDSNRFSGNNRLRIAIDYANVVPEINELNNNFEKDVAVGFNALVVVLNSNKKDVLGDEREMRVLDRFGKEIGGAKVAITYPSGNGEEILSDSAGVVRLQLTEPGNYLISAEKASYTSYSGAFNMKAITVSGIGDLLNVGEVVDFTVETEDGNPVPDATIEIEYPTGEKAEISINQLGQGQIRPTIAGGHKIIVRRNGVKVFESGFIATGLVESLFIGSDSLGELLFGGAVRNPTLFLMLLAICLIASALAYNRSKMLFLQKAKSTREKQIEIAVRLGIAVLFFILPFQVNRFFGLQAAIGFVIIEVATVLIVDYYAKQLRRKRAIGVR